MSPALSRLVPPDRFVLPGFRLWLYHPPLPPSCISPGNTLSPIRFTDTLLAAWRISLSGDLLSTAPRCLCSAASVSDPPLLSSPLLADRRSDWLQCPPRTEAAGPLPTPSSSLYREPGSGLPYLHHAADWLWRAIENW